MSNANRSQSESTQEIVYCEQAKARFQNRDELKTRFGDYEQLESMLRPHLVLSS
jgi:hypothetical protein